MTQALFTSMTGLNAGTEQLTVVSDNVANMNTTAYKTSRVDFQDIWYSTKTTGTNSTRVSGGTNPYQIGVGVQCASITKDFAPSSTNTTGRTEDMAITGNGWFTVINSDGKCLLTRDGTFALDENGFLCTASGCKVLGTNNMESLTNSTTPIKIPTQIKVVEGGTKNNKFANMVSADLNALSSAVTGFTSGAFNVIEYDAAGNASAPITIKIPKNYDPNDETTHTIGTMTMNQIAEAIQQQSGGKFTVATGDGTFSFKPTNANATLKFETLNEGVGGTNFVAATNIANTPKGANGAYTTPILSMTATIGQVDDVTSDYTHNYDSFSVGKDGLVTVTYGDGSILTVKANENGTTYFSFQDANGIIIDDDLNKSLEIDPNILVLANMQMQLAKVTNDSGLVAEGSNMYSVGVDSGLVLYTAANINGVGSVVTGALESSNVDLAQQFSNMILAQRLVQANSQVFSGANSLLETLVYLGN
ncbi:MAG: flagellar hook-basal body complex protein [Candidatus Gastranaerophilales bacterium]|nr:flagellar hook-basal body complex protein [Candidatus Gastranaerophilales bacterium]